MTIFRISKIFFFLLMLSHFSMAQLHKREFTSPLNIPLKLSGSFCEVRSDHFHSGIDIKTNGREGLPVFSVNDGYVYRIKVSATGYGKAIYVMHPGNILSVYGHLSAFVGAVADSIEALQYRAESYDVEYFPDSTLFRFKRGEQIAWSGNSGRSEAPHLHFEIRDQLKEEPLNPLLYDWFVEDTISPFIQNVSIYNFNNSRFKEISTIAYSEYDTIEVDVDSIAIAIQAVDYSNESNASIGFYSASVTSASDTIFQIAFNRMNFDQTRFVNAYIDFTRRLETGRTFQRLYCLPGNKSNMFRDSGSGIIALNANEVRKVDIKLNDINGNYSKQTLFFKRSQINNRKGPTPDLIYPVKPINKSWKDASIEIPADAFYQSVDAVSVNRIKRKRNCPVLSITTTELAFHKTFLIRFVMKGDKFKGKHTVVMLNEKYEIISAIGGVLKGSMLTANSRKTGLYSVAIDTVSPVVESYKFENDTVNYRSFLTIKIKDNLTGIESYSCKVDGKWFLFENDAKTNRLIADARKLPGVFDLELMLEDKCGNVLLKKMSIKNPYQSSE